MQFSVENYLSFREQAVLSLIPSSDKEHPENINEISGSKYRALNGILVYGANASGKTNLFKAMTVALNLVRRCSELQPGQPIPIVPFKMDNDSKKKPSSFEFQFIADDGNKYVYGFKASVKRIEEEYLYCYYSNQPTKIFDRTQCTEYSYSRGIKSRLETFEKVTNENRLFLSASAAWNATVTRAAYEWLSLGIDTYTNLQEFQDRAFEYYRDEKDQDKRDYLDFTSELLQQADIKISRIDFDYRTLTEDQVNQLPSIIVNNQLIRPQTGFEHKVITKHSLEMEDGTVVEQCFGMGEESLGTELLLYFGPLLKDTFSKGKVMMIDEIDRSLHPYIVKHIIQLFQNKKYNKKGAQLIATTHDTSQMTLKQFRRDQIFFTEINPKTASTDLYSLDDFELPVRKTDNIEKGYLQGRYGAIPYVQPEVLIA